MSHADMKEYSWRKYRIEPYLATVCLRVTHALDHLAAGADSMTGYGFLPDFTEPMWRSIQNYREQVIKRIEEWDISRIFLPLWSDGMCLLVEVFLKVSILEIFKECTPLLLSRLGMR